MTDIFTKEKRRKVMSSIRGSNTKLEHKAFALLKEAGMRFRRYPKGIAGKPDAANKSMKLAIFVDSRFWHGYNWRKNKGAFRPDQKFWIEKIRRNMARDREVNRHLLTEGWKVIRIWEHELHAKSKEKTLWMLRKEWRRLMKKRARSLLKKPNRA